MELLRAVAAAPDRAVLIVTHDSRIHGFADRIVEMEDGRVLGERPPPPAGHEGAIHD
jgi:putative ABC transport system ATP-binding protein